ncbi:G-protein coupled receptor 54-like [Branchiostoma floridae]|uniref:G-protein coupled receptor 54-like n=2 Tax=Branchiostoma floridae TaxID=7739 RepID=A0A9J7LA60_BRAFL|nr:G-protein coupled receptor 54-like [Branchiostoma floridae]
MGDEQGNDGVSEDTLRMTMDAYVAPVLFSIPLLVGATGNALVIYVVARFSEMRTVTNYYIVNLAITDLSFLLCCVPFSAANYALPSWIFGRVLCKLINYLMQVTTQATCITLCIMSVDRFCAIVYPLRSLRFRRKRVAVIVNAITWLVSFLTAIPVCIFHDLTRFNWYGFRTYCRPAWPSKAWEDGYMIFTIAFTYVLPLIICSVTCSLVVKRLHSRFRRSESRPQHHEVQTRRITRMVVGVVIVFLVCWLPNHVINMWRYIHIKNKFSPALYYGKMVALFLIYCNCALNPFIYTLIGENFRNCLKQIVSRTSSNSSSQSTKLSHPGFGFRKSNESAKDLKNIDASPNDRIVPDPPAAPKEVVVDVELNPCALKREEVNSELSTKETE